MNPLGNRARVEELARLLDGAVAGPASSTAGYAALATRLRAASPAIDDALGVRDEFRTALRTRLLAVAAVQGVGAVPIAVASPAVSPAAGIVDRAVTWTRVWTNQKRMAVASGAMAAVVAVAGVGIATSRSLPGQPFYGLKRATESLQLGLAGSDTDKGTKHLEFAATRLREVRALAEGENELALGSGSGNLASGIAYGGPLAKRISDTLRDFDSETKSGQSLLEGVYRRTGKTAPLRILSTFSTQSKHQLAALLPELPTASKAVATSSLTLVTALGTTTNQLLGIGTCTAACNPVNAGPTLPVQPGPTPTESASSTPDNNGVQPCTCDQPTATPEPTPAPSPSPSQTEGSSPSPKPTPKPTHSPSPLPIPLPIPLPTILPTGLPSPLPALPPLPVTLPTALPSLLPGTGSIVKP